ncbi:MAG: ThuA domain-containing protein [Chloroflexota bacterium]
MKRLVVVLLAALALGGGSARTKVEAVGPQARPVNWSKVRLLLYTRNGAGYVHQNIPASIEAIKALAAEHKFVVDASDDPAVFTDDNLKKYSALVFSNTNNVVFDTDAQRVALMRYVQAGGGFAAIHSASGTERTWKWFAGLLGGAFSRHAPMQKFGVVILDRAHPSLAHLPPRWERDDECYYLVKMNVNMKVLAVNDLSTIQDPKGEKPAIFGDVFPSVWSQEFDGGRQWYTSLGHRKEDYLTPEFRQHILGGIRSVVRNAPLDYTRAYAVSPADDVKKR